ncbi:bacteriocin immunity protein [Lactiplantibacillus pentosus]
MMKSEAQGIIQDLYQELAPTAVNEGIRAELCKAHQQLQETPELDESLLKKLTNYITYTIFTQQLRLTPTQNLLVSELLSLSHRLSA